MDRNIPILEIHNKPIMGYTQYGAGAAYSNMVESNRIRVLRDAAGISRRELAERIGTSIPQIIKLERGERRLSQHWMERISSGLGVKPADLLPDPEITTGLSESLSGFLSQKPPRILAELQEAVAEAIADPDNTELEERLISLSIEHYLSKRTPKGIIKISPAQKHTILLNVFKILEEKTAKNPLEYRETS